MNEFAKMQTKRTCLQAVSSTSMSINGGIKKELSQIMLLETQFEAALVYWLLGL